VTADCKIVMVRPEPTAVVRMTVATTGVREAQQAARAKIAAALPTLDCGVERYGCTLWHPPKAGRLYMEPGVIVSRAFAPAGDVVPSELPGGRAARYVMHGPYEGLPDAWKLLLDWVEARKLTPAGTNWEIYGDDHPDPAKLKVTLYVLLM
jgi:effector-binding domain-containing protein